MSHADYENKITSYYTQERAEMLPFIPPCSRILEVGCGDGAFMRTVRSKHNVYAVGIEPFATGTSAAHQVFDRLLTVPLADAALALEPERFDCIVCNDVLEHLEDPWAALRTLGSLLAPGGSIVASIPNMRHFPVIQSLLVDGDWEYQEYGILDRTHLRFFTRKSMIRLFRESGFSIQHIEGINPGWTSWKWHVLNFVLRGALTDTRYQQFACVATRV